jgi:surfactin synthase thioesterase subunit
MRPAIPSFFGEQEKRLTAPVCCICVPHAGGSHTAFAAWQVHLRPHVQVLAVRLPGRGPRVGEPPYCQFNALVDDLILEAASLLDRRFLIFGHSLGALIAYELCRRLFLQYGLECAHLFVSGCRAPHVAVPPSATLARDSHVLTDEQLTARLKLLGGMTDEVAEHGELLACCLRAVRADLMVFESYALPNNRAGTKVRCSITALGGTEDFLDVPETSLKEWERYTSADFRVQMLLGDHFFVYKQPPSIAAAIVNALGLS